jgi:thiol-disulfide isomerase/thioredoxin
MAGVYTMGAAVAVVGAIGLFNLVLLYGVIRRLREHGELLAGGAGGAGDPPLGLAVDATVPDFAVTDGDGRGFDRAELAGPDGERLVAFLTPNCPTCAQQLPDLVDLAGATADRGRVVAAVLGGEAETAEQVASLSPVARVVSGRDSEALAEAFAVRGYPAFFVVREGVVRAVDWKVARLPVGTPA